MQFLGYTQLYPKKIKFFIPFEYAALIRLDWIEILSKINSALYLLLEYIPPTLAAAIKMKSGFCFFKKLKTFFWSLRSSCFFVL